MTQEAPARNPGALQGELTRSLANPLCYPHPAQQLHRIETHISIVFLAGEFAYKIKKAVRLEFLDFSTLEARRHFCDEEVRLNRRTAPQLYLEVVPIAGPPSAPRISGPGRAIEYAVRMRRFSQGHLLDRLAGERSLTPAIVDRLASTVARFHGSLPGAGADSRFGCVESIAAQTRANFSDLARLGLEAGAATMLETIRSWSERGLERLGPVFSARKAEGRVRECHGDLHLGNIALLAGEPTPFDCIEFNEALRWNDVASEIAFLGMDLMYHGAEPLAFRCINNYLEHTGDYGALAVLRHYLVYRAMVRAKVARIRAVQEQAAHSPECDAHLCLAQALARSAHPAVILMHGLSASGKTALSAALVEHLRGVRLRSDVERKRLAGLPPGARTASGLCSDLYGAEVTARTYERLLAVTQVSVLAGWPVIVDATFLKRAERDAFHHVAQRAGAPFAIVSCRAPDSVLRERILARVAAAADASEATLEVLEHQMRLQEPLGLDELHSVLVVDTAQPLDADLIARRIKAGPPAGH